MKILGVIPARYGSTRLPGKPLLKVGSKSVICHVYENVVLNKQLDEVIVATDDQRIFKEIESIGGNVIMTSPEHINGTERCAEVASKYDHDWIINVQGDEVSIESDQIDEIVELFDHENQIVSLATRMNDPKELVDPSKVKVIMDGDMNAINFGRSSLTNGQVVFNQHFKHVGIYAYQRKTLMEIASIDPTKRELSEHLEQLRWVDHGFKIKMGITAKNNISIDTLEHLQAIRKIIQ